MRPLLLALLMALLPLRAWVGDAMAVSMLSPGPAHATMAMNQTASAPCPDHVAVAQDPSSAPGDEGVHKHGACDVCNGPAMSFPIQTALALSAAHGHHAGPAERFASLVLPSGTKPPIS